MSFKAEVQADNTGTWAGNALRFATEAEAASYGSDLMGRWMLVRAVRVTVSEDQVNYIWDNARGAVSIEQGAVT